MTSRSPSSRRASLRTLVALGLLGLVAAGAAMLTVHFAADFDSSASSAPGSHGPGFKAEVGDFVVAGDADVFQLETAPAGGGELDIGPNTGSQPASLGAELDPEADDVTADIKLKLRPLFGFGDLVLRVADENDTGMIDLTFTRNGDVRYDGSVAEIPGDIGDTLDVWIRVHDPNHGMPTARIQISGPNGTVSFNGPLPLGELSIAKFIFVRPAGTEGNWRADDLYITSIHASPWKVWASVLDLTGG